MLIGKRELMIGGMGALVAGQARAEPTSPGSADQPPKTDMDAQPAQVAANRSRDPLQALSDENGARLVGFKSRGAGAVARSLEDKLNEIEINVNDFGAVPNDSSIGVARANWTAIRNALAHVLREETPAVRERKKRLVFGEGEYFIAGNSPLMFNRTEMAALPGAYRYRGGFSFVGKGRDSTILRLVSENNGDRWFYSTHDAAYAGRDTNVADAYSFTGITFRGTKPAGGNVTQASGSKTNGFYWESYGFEKFVTFTDCNLEYLDQVFAVSGYGNVDHNKFFGCSFSNIRDYVFGLDNNQSVSWALYACNADMIHGRVFQIGANGGGDLIWVGGTVSLYPEVDTGDQPLAAQRQKGFLHWDNSTKTAGPSSGPGNSKFTFHQLRFEVYAPSQAIVVSRRRDMTSYGNIDVTFSDCSFAHALVHAPNGGVPRVDYVGVDLENSACVRFVRCDLVYHFAYTLRKHDPQLTFEDCQFLHANEGTVTNTEGLAGRCAIAAGNGGISARGTRARRNVTNGGYNGVMVADFNKGTVTQVPPFFSAQVKDPLSRWPQSNAAGNLDIHLPAGTLILGFTVDKPAETVASPTRNANFALTQGDGSTVIGTVTAQQSQNAALLSRQMLSTPYRVPAAPNNVVRFVPGGDAVSTPWTGTAGSLYLELA